MRRLASVLLAGMIILHCGEDDGTPGVISGIIASSEHEVESGRYRADWLLGGSDAASWVEGKADDGIGETVTFLFNKKVRISRIAIRNGYGDPKYFALNNRVKEIAFAADQGTETIYTLKDTMSWQEIDLKTTLKAKQVTLKIVSVYKGSRYSDTALSGVRFFKKADNSFEEFSISTELQTRIRSAATDEFIALYVDESNSSEHHFLDIQRNGKCRTVSLTTYNGNREDRSCTWKRSKGSLILREQAGEAETAYNLLNSELKKETGSTDRTMFSPTYRVIMQEKSTSPGEYHPMDYIAKEEKSARAALESHR